MHSSNSKAEFPHWWVYQMVARVHKRMKSFYRNTLDRKHVNRDERTWGRSCMANIVKMRYRLSSPHQIPKPNDDWGHVISFQKRRWSQRLDYVNAWQRREFFILEKMNGQRLPERRDLGSVWKYAAMLQCAMISRKRNKWRPRVLRSRWADIQRNLRPRLQAQYSAKKEDRRTDWQVTILALGDRLRKDQHWARWREVIWNGYRRLQHIYGPEMSKSFKSI